MNLAPFPPAAAWAHVDARDGFESVFFDQVPDGGVRIEGACAAVEEGVAWLVRYVITTDSRWHTRSAVIDGRSSVASHRTVTINGDGDGHWTVDGLSRPDLDGCFDVDLEASACTNALPLRHLDLDDHETVDAPAVYVRASGLAVTRLAQDYTLSDDAGADTYRFGYRSPTFDVESVLTYDHTGLILDYPGLAHRYSPTSPVGD